MTLRPPRSTHTDTLFPYTTLFRAYRYFAYPLPPLVEALRGMLYARLAPIANRWHERMGMDVRFPAEHGEFLVRCHDAGQRRPTHLLLRYGAGDYNCLH